MIEVLNVRIPRKLYRRVKVTCIEADRALRDFVQESLREYLRLRRR